MPRPDGRPAGTSASLRPFVVRARDLIPERGGAAGAEAIAANASHPRPKPSPRPAYGFGPVEGGSLEAAPPERGPVAGRRAGLGRAPGDLPVRKRLLLLAGVIAVLFGACMALSFSDLSSSKGSTASAESFTTS